MLNDSEWRRKSLQSGYEASAGQIRDFLYYGFNDEILKSTEEYTVRNRNFDKTYCFFRKNNKSPVYPLCPASPFHYYGYVPTNRETEHADVVAAASYKKKRKGKAKLMPSLMGRLTCNAMRILLRTYRGRLQGE